MNERSTAGALATVLRGSAVPYGYALTVWAAHSVLIDRHGNPAIGEIAMFIVGAIGAFALLGLFAQRFAGGSAPAPGSLDLIRTGAIHALAIGAALGVTIAAAALPATVAWPLGSFAATAVYLTLASLELLVTGRIDEELEDRRRR